MFSVVGVSAWTTSEAFDSVPPPKFFGITPPPITEAVHGVHSATVVQ